MRKIIRAAVVVLLLSSYASAADLDNIWTIRKGESHRSSSADPNWQNGNGDCRPIEPGATLTVADVEGPGMIRHIWFTIAARDPAYGRSIVLRMYWDDQTEPAVESPLGDFFAVGHGVLKSVNSAPISVTSDGRAYNCYWPMPYGRHAKITLTNDSKKYRVDCVFWYVDYYKVSKLPAEKGYFHAQYRQEYPCKMGEDYLILDAEGEGQYVGTVLSAQLRAPSWFGEGDDRFYIDGAKEPQLRGTGTEDYFCDAWGFRLIDRPYYGITLLEGYETGDRLTAYRWHIPDPVLFSKSLKMTIEHKGVGFDKDNKLVSGFDERQDLFSSVAYWYQKGPAKRYATLPPVEERTVPVETIEFEAFLAGVKSEPDMPHQIQDGSYSAGKQILFTSTDPKAKLTIPFELKSALKGLGQLKLTQSFDYGIFKIGLDGKPVAGLDRVDLYNPEVRSKDLRVGFIELAEGPHTLTLECVGKNPESKGYFVGVDSLSVQQLTPYITPRK